MRLAKSLSTQMVKRVDPRMVIKEHRPWREWFFSILLVAVGGMVGWLISVPFTKLVELTPDESILPSAHNPRKLLSQVERENARLRESLARIQWKLAVEHQTRLDLSGIVSALQNEIMELKGQLATYKDLVGSPQEQGLHIQSFTLSKTETERLLNYHLVLTQGGRRDQLTQGKGQFFIYGVLNGKPARLELNTLSKGVPLTFEFKYFQIIEGELLLPNNFNPTRIRVVLFPEDDPSVPIERAFDWASLES